MSLGKIPQNLVHVMLFASILFSIPAQADPSYLPVAESAEFIVPLAAGDRAPGFVVQTVAGEPFDFDPLELERPVVLLTFRGGWCPYCNVYLKDMREVIPAIAELGVDVLFLSGDRPALLYESLSRETQEEIAGLNYTILSDADAQAATALGIAFKASEQTIDGRHRKGDDIEGSSMLKHGILPVPAVFAINRSGIIRFAFSNADYKVRLPADDLLAVARDIAAAD